MAKRASPTKLTLAWLKKRGCVARVTERFVKAPKMKGFGFRKDLFGGDLMACAGKDLINIQAGITSDHAAKIRKASEHPDVKSWLLTGNKFLVITWSKRPAFNASGARSKRDLWTPRISQLQLDCDAVTSHPFEVAD